MTPEKEVEDKVRELLAGAKSLYLSTTAGDAPWGAGAHFAEVDPFTLLLVLEASGRTLSNIRANPRVAMVVSSGAPYDPFLQGDADVEVVTDEAEDQQIRSALLAKVPEIEPFLHAPLVAVRLLVRRWRATDVPNGWLPGREIVARQSPSA